MTTLESQTPEAAQALQLLRQNGARLVTIFGSLDDDGGTRVHYLVDINREYRMLSTRADGPISSATRINPSAAWYERETSDQFGVEFAGHPDPRPLLFHECWPAGAHPLAGIAGNPGEMRPEYRFVPVRGIGVCEVPVGPVHAGIIEPGHFRFSVVGDTVVHLELRHFYTHKGVEALFAGVPVERAVTLAESVSGDNCFAHAVAYCQAVENLCGATVPPRGQALRLIGLELERLMAHIADFGAMCGDVGFSLPTAYTARIKESLLQASTRFFGTRCWRGLATPGGMRRDLPVEAVKELARIVAAAEKDFAEMAAIALDAPSLLNRFQKTGILGKQIAQELGTVGVVARASGLRHDVRHDHPYGQYRKLTVEVVSQTAGDAFARARQRVAEARVSAQLIAQTLGELPAGIVATTIPATFDGESFSAVESPRGELLYWLRIKQGRIARCHIKSPSFQNWPALPHAMKGNIIADFPLVNKSFNLSYSGCDR
jgi:Ni,Fe-hydrogenase III large subunit/Ni,Fe-hydrogenase III component G